ncbi:MAG: ABC transporter ATP-binding protein [Candidatus Bipolaricaulia bacterium]
MSKTFNGTRVVEDLSFSVQAGEIFGLIGPNGAGKTTTIRMLLHILQPDTGEVSLFGCPLDAEARHRIGYLPEERGLYRQARTEEVLVYLSQLKGLSAQEARRRAAEVLEQLVMAEHAHKKISELSRGMSQLIQFGVTVIHQPDLVILDEPFAGLDPVNTQRLKELVADLQARDAAVILSTHQMNAVEELCDQVLMINRGQTVLYGPVTEVKQRYRNNSLFIVWDGPRDEVSEVVRWEDRGLYWEAFLADDISPEEALQKILCLGGTLSLFQLSSPSLNEVFLRVVSEGKPARE